MRSIPGKIVYSAVVLFGVASLVFVLFNILPGDPARMMLDQRDDPVLLESIRKKYGLDQPTHIQYLLYLNDLSPLSVHSSLEESYSAGVLKEVQHLTLFGAENFQVVVKYPYLRQSFQRQGKKVSDIIANTLPNTILLAVASMLLAISFGLLIGILSALNRNSIFDRFFSVFGTLGMSLPSFFTAILMAWLLGYVLAAYTGLNITGSLLEVDDYTGERVVVWKNLILPAITLGMRPLGVIIQISRSAMLDVMSQDFIRTARAKGLSKSTIVMKHALRNALNPVVTVVSGWFAGLLAGAVFIEYIFSWNGLGKEIVDALNYRDLPVVMGAVLVIAALFTLINILVDAVYAILDPRLR
jgi:peptide/nickel transport system permease protein